MGLLSLFTRGGSSGTLMRLPQGSFTVDRNGSVSVSTLPHAFPRAVLDEIAVRVLEGFRDARTAQLPLTEIVVDYAALRLTARELRGGAIIFLSPRSLNQK